MAKLLGLEIYNVKLKYTDIILLKISLEILLLLFKMEIRLVCTRGNVCKDELQN